MSKEKGLSQKRITQMIMSKAAYFTHRNSRELVQTVRSVLERQQPNERYIMTALTHMLREKYFYVSFHEKKTPYYSLTDNGRNVYKKEKKVVPSRVRAVQKVAQTILYDITKDGEKPSTVEVLPSGDRTFFSSIVSAQDVFRYYVLREAMKQPDLVMADIQGSIEKQFGWKPSKSYIHQLALAMEEDKTNGPLLKGKWTDPRIRHKRYWRITKAGHDFFPRLEQDTVDRVRNTYYYLQDILSYIEKKE
ncbi:hypothetical protein [Alteribacillus bidgolensis]|uniref:Transcriptional regulator PadR-like family protein n=1 Tax=Alteribacillus bidgolensis TaxID=930129 RepID=A0A1G8RNE5_9BACI|nr:hypothetical protein [Alteribacillus bidgolensis]SDJ18507.1 hypothetical protein SAMN05216352_13010 [Alteribacillus bidgolensis]